MSLGKGKQQNPEPGMEAGPVECVGSRHTFQASPALAPQ